MYEVIDTATAVEPSGVEPWLLGNIPHGDHEEKCGAVMLPRPEWAIYVFVARPVCCGPTLPHGPQTCRRASCKLILRALWQCR